VKVSGFTIARNVVRADYPIKEAVMSILPLCHEVVIAVGKSEDETLEYIKSWNIDKIKIIETVWDDSRREGGRVLADETNKAMAATSPDSDWLFYIQADEVIHEQYLTDIKQAMETWKDNKNVEGLLFNYLHFYGTYDYIGDSRRWYRNEVRVIKNNGNIKSWGDAMGFRTLGDQKLAVKPANAAVYHYGWVKHPKHQQQKQKQFHKLWHSDEKLKTMISEADEFDYSEVDSLKKFQGTHPQVMRGRVDSVDWQFPHDLTKKNFTAKTFMLYWIEKLTGWRVGEYKNYKKI
jgi:glycosyltransferase involved in cell wall biosynthesis